MRQGDSGAVGQWSNGTVWQWDTVWQIIRAVGLWSSVQCGSVTGGQCGSGTVWQWDSVTMDQRETE